MECLDDGVLVKLLAGSLPVLEMEALEAHCDLCGDCFDLVAAVVTGAEDGDPVGRSSKPNQLERIGRFELLEPLGAGGMGVVRAARCVETGDLVALKEVRGVAPGAVAALRQEIHSLGELDHPGIVRIVDQGVAAGLPWYAMELIRGDRLRDVVARLSPRRKLRFADLLPTLGIVR
jgi:hypothetical protein